MTMRRARFLVTALLALGAAAGCGGDDTKANRYPAAVEATFMRECKRTSGTRSTICRCAFDKIEARISYDEFKREDTAIAAGAKPSRKFTDAIADCR
jgi:hypothetical protein